MERSFWIKLLLPLITPKARTVLNRISSDFLDNCEQVKQLEIREMEGKEPVKMNALSDSGAEIPVISEELLEGRKVEQMGKENLQCATCHSCKVDEGRVHIMF